MAEYTIEITQYCPHNCNYCSTNATENGMHIDIETIKQFLYNYNSILTTDRINISGGEPLSHPKFYEILQLCKQLTPDVWVYTNELTQIRYNTSVIEEIKVEANVCLMPGEDVYIPKNAHKVHLLQFVPTGRGKDIKTVNMKISGENCAKCNHKVLQANGKIVDAPCKKNYNWNEMRWLTINKDKYIIQVNPVIDYAMRGLCRKPYYNHPKGCPNFRKRSDCPPFAPLFDKYIDMSKPIYAIYNIFDFKSHMEKMKLKHPNWSEHQLKCVLYWQGSARKQLRLKCEEFMKEYEELGYEIITCPEAMGVNLTETMKNIGIILEWPPVNITYQIAIAGIKK